MHAPNIQFGEKTQIETCNRKKMKNFFGAFCSRASRARAHVRANSITYYYRNIVATP